MTESELILAAVWRWFPPRRWAVCDCVSDGFGLPYEAAAVAVSKSGVVHELEAKSDKADLLRDASKKKWVRFPQSDCFWYVVPEPLRDAAVAAARPIGGGVIAVSPLRDGYAIGDSVRVLMPGRRRPRDASGGVRPRDRRNCIWRLCSLRYWDGRIRAVQVHG